MNHLTTTQLAQRWSMHPGTLKNWRCSHPKKGPVFTRIGQRKIIYLLKDIEAFEIKNREKGQLWQK